MGWDIFLFLCLSISIVSAALNFFPAAALYTIVGESKSPKLLYFGIAGAILGLAYYCLIFTIFTKTNFFSDHPEELELEFKLFTISLLFMGIGLIWSLLFRVLDLRWKAQAP